MFEGIIEIWKMDNGCLLQKKVYKFSEAEGNDRYAYEKI